MTKKRSKFPSGEVVKVEEEGLLRKKERKRKRKRKRKEKEKKRKEKTNEKQP